MTSNASGELREAAAAASLFGLFDSNDHFFAVRQKNLETARLERSSNAGASIIS
jgi:hypothetical protein